METTYYFIIKQISIPAPKSFLSHHSVLIKWRCGKQSGKLPLVPMGTNVDLTRKQPTVLVDFPPSVKVTLDTAISIVTLDVIVVRHVDARREEEKDRQTISSHVPFNLGGVGSKLGIPQNGMLMLGISGFICLEYSTVRADGLVGQDASSCVFATTSSPSVAVSSSPGGLEAAFVMEDGDTFDTADASITEGITSTSGVGNVLSLNTIVNEGLFKAALFENPPDEAAESLFFAQRSIWEAFHILREDELAEIKPWKYTGTKRCCFRTNFPKLRFGKNGKKISANEQCYVTRVEDDYIARTIVYSNDVPMVGAGVKLDLVFHITTDGEGGSVIAVFVHVTASDLAKRLGGSMIGKYVDKIMAKAHEALEGLLTIRRLQGRDRGRKSYRNMKFRSSVCPAANTALDPCLWRRLVSTDTLPNKELVYQYLSRLLTIKVLRVTETQVSSLESVIVYHRESVPVVSACLNLLIMLAKASSYSVVHNFSPTLWPTIESIFALHKPETFLKYQELLSHLSRHQRQRQREKEEMISRERNVWDVIDGMMVEADLVEKCLKAAAATRLTQLTPSQVLSMTKAVTLHLQSEDIVRYALQITARAHGSIHFFPAATVSALVIGSETHHLDAEFADVLAQLNKRSHSLTHFERQFGTLSEKYLFHCNAWMTGPKLSPIQLYVTANYLVVGPFVLPMDSIHKVVQYRSLTLRQGIRVIMSASHDDYFVVLSKRRELLALLDKRRVLIDPPFEGDY